MSISEIINGYGQMHSPYMRNLVNHLPMGQLALYKLTNSLDKVNKYSEDYTDKAKINPIKIQYPHIESLEDCVGNRELYESALDLVSSQLNHDNIDYLIEDVVNSYELGMSSGLFHTIIRLAYAVEAYKLDKKLIDEVARALSYYITAYREGKVLKRVIEGSTIIDEMDRLGENKHIKELLEPLDSLGQRIKQLYEDDEYLSKGFVLGASEEGKIRALLKLLIPTYLNSKNIVVLHSITGLHAIIVLKKYFKDFDRALDIFTSFIVTHLIAVDNLRYKSEYYEHTGLSWECIKIKASESPDVHAIKLTYSCYQLDKLYDIPELKDCALKRIKFK